MHLRAVTTNFVFVDQLAFTPQGAGGLPHSKKRKQCAIVAGTVITCGETEGKAFLARNKRGTKKWEDVTNLVGLPHGDAFAVVADPPIIGEEPVSEDFDNEPSPELQEFAGSLAEVLHEAGFTDEAAIAHATVEQLSRLKGIGKTTAEKLIADAKGEGGTETEED